MAEFHTKPLWRRVAVLGHGLLAYLAFQVSVLYFTGFLANVGAINGIDEGSVVPLVEAVTVNIVLLVLWGIQHSGMARSWFKDRLTRFIPEPGERSTYVLATSVVLFGMAWFWRPIPTVIWDVNGPASWMLWGLFVLGLAIIILSTFQIGHAEMFGLRQVYDYYRGREPTADSFRTPGFYRYVRNPVMTGTIVWVWATPHMTVGHLLLAAGFTVYILIGVSIEEREMLEAYGEEFREYRQTVPMLFPRPWRSFESGTDQSDRSPD